MNCHSIQDVKKRKEKNAHWPVDCADWLRPGSPLVLAQPDIVTWLAVYAYNS